MKIVINIFKPSNLVLSNIKTIHNFYTKNTTSNNAYLLINVLLLYSKKKKTIFLH